MLGKRLDVFRNSFAFGDEIVGYCAAQSGMGDVVGGIGWHRHVAAQKFVFALRAGFDLGELVRNRELDRLIITGLEMEEWDVFVAAPIAPEQHAAARKVERTGDMLLAASRQDEDDLFAHALANTAEEFAREVGPAPFSSARVHVEIEEDIPMRFRDVAAGEPVEFDTFREYSRAFLAQVFPFGRRQCGEELIEIRVAAIFPMELLIVALEITQRAGVLPFIFGHEGNVQRRCAEFAYRRRPGGEQRAAGFFLRRIFGDQQSPSRHRRERHAGLKLGIVATAGPLECIGPTVIEHIFALGMTFQIERKNALNGTVFLNRQMARPPTTARGGGAGLLAGREEFVARERVRIGAALRIRALVPGCGADIRRRARNPRDDGRFRHASSNIASTSQATLRGRDPAPTAARAWRPASPRTSTKRSEAPFATSGCCVNPGTAFTKAVTFTQRFTLSRSPPHAALICASTLMAQIRAAALPSSTEMSLPTMPTYLMPSGATVIWPDVKTSFCLLYTS